MSNILDIQEVALQKSDFDMVNLIDELIKEEVCTSEWKVKVNPDLDESKNFTLPIVQAFLDFKEKEHKSIKNCDPTKTNLLRRIVTLKDIEDMILHEQNRAEDLVDEAHRIEREIMERERQRIIQKNTRRLQQRKLAFKASETTKRRNSFKGRVHKGVVKKGLEMHNLKNKVSKGDPKRATSSENTSRRVNIIRRTIKERDLRFDDGYIPNVVHDDKISDVSGEVNEGIVSEGTLDDTIDECEDFLFGLELDMDEKSPREIAEELKKNYEIVTEQLTNLKQIGFTNPVEAAAFDEQKSTLTEQQRHLARLQALLHQAKEAAGGDEDKMDLEHFRGMLTSINSGQELDSPGTLKRTSGKRKMNDGGENNDAQNLPQNILAAKLKGLPP